MDHWPEISCYSALWSDDSKYAAVENLKSCKTGEYYISIMYTVNNANPYYKLLFNRKFIIAFG